MTTFIGVLSISLLLLALAVRASRRAMVRPASKDAARNSKLTDPEGCDDA